MTDYFVEIASFYLPYMQPQLNHRLTVVNISCIATGKGYHVSCMSWHNCLVLVYIHYGLPVNVQSANSYQGTILVYL